MTHILQRREQHGLIRTLAKSPHQFDPKEVLKTYGPGPYCDKDTSPRFHVSWKGWLGEQTQQTDFVKQLSDDVLDLKKKSNYLAVGEGLLAIGEGVGFGVIALKLIDYVKRLTVVESIVGAINAKNPIGFVCPRCGQVLADPLDPFCATCGDRLDWTNARRQNITGALLCANCLSPLRSNQNFCTRCGRSLVSRDRTNAILQFVPVQQRSRS